MVGGHEINHHGLRRTIPSSKWTLEASAEATRSMHHHLGSTKNLTVWSSEDTRNRGALVQCPAILDTFNQSGDIMVILLFILRRVCTMRIGHVRPPLQSYLRDNRARVRYIIEIWCSQNGWTTASHSMKIWLFHGFLDRERADNDGIMTQLSLTVEIRFSIAGFSRSWFRVIFCRWEFSCSRFPVSFCEQLTLFRKGLRLISCEASDSEFWTISLAKSKLFCVLGHIIKDLSDLLQANFHPHSHCIISGWSPAWFQPQVVVCPPRNPDEEFSD